MADRRILLGVVGRPHGVRGLVRVVSYTADPASLTAYGDLSDDHGRRFALRWRGEGVAEIAELRDGEAVPAADRNAAEKLVNTRLYIDRACLPPPEDEEFYLADLVGLAAFDVAGAALGAVAAVHDYGAGASLEIARAEGAALLVPFTRAAVPEVDPAAGRVTVVPPDETAVPIRAEAAA
jgi:16S rRNA processing protein RimM